MKFSDLAKYKAGPELVVSPRHEEWMAHNANPVYSPEALAFGAEQLAAQAKPRDRRGTISASSLNSCRRRQQFTFIGMPELPPTPKLAAIFQTGTFMHIRWQMAGLTEGWMTAGEVPVPKANPYRLAGTQDGVAYDNTVVELKSCNSNSFSRVMTFGPLQDHPFQVGTYVLVTDAPRGTIIYENKDTQEYKEIVLERDQLPLRDIVEINEKLWEKNDKQELAEPLLDCENKAGFKYNGCPFRKDCLAIRDWKEAEDVADWNRRLGG